MKTIAYRFVVLGFVLAVAGPKALSQEYFSNITTPTDLAPVAPSTPGTPESPENNPAARVDIANPGLPPEAAGEDKYNMAVGPVHFGMAAGIGLEYNDNVNLAPSGQRIADFSVRPSLTVDASYQFSEMNTLRFSLGASYEKYFRHSEFDSRSVLLSPNSELAFTMHVGNVAITLRDRFSYQEDPFQLPVLSGVAVYRRFENQIGVQADWAVNEMFKVTAGYDHYNLWTFDSEFDQLEHSVDTVYVKPGYAITPGVTVGVNASVSFTSFTEDIQNGGTNYFLGPFIDAALTDNTHLYVEGGWQKFDFDHNGTINDNSQYSSWYAKTELANRLSENFSQHLTFSKAAEIGFGSNYYDLYHVEYAASWQMMQNLTLQPSLFYEHYTTSAPVGLQGEDANRFGASIGLRYILTPSLTLGLDYRYVYKDSNLPGLDYRQNLVLLSLYYNF